MAAAQRVASGGEPAALACGCAAPQGAALWGWARIIFSAILAVNSMAVALAVNTASDAPGELRTVRLALAGVTLLVAALVGGPLLAGAWQALRAGRLGVEFLFVLTLGGALGVSVQSMLAGDGPVYFEVVSILLVVYAFGAQLNRSARERALAVAGRYGAERRFARVRAADGSERWKPASEVLPGDTVVVLPGEMVPVEGILASGGLFEESNLRGEFVPVSRGAGSRVPAGAAVIDSQVVLQAAAEADAAGLDGVLCAVRRSLEAPAEAQRAADRLTRWFLPVVFGAALLTFAGWSLAASPGRALFHAMAVLLVACPCALGFATPLALNTAVNRLREHGIALARVADVEALAAVDCLIFDKTGTLSPAAAAVESIHWRDGWAERAGQVLPLVAAAECGLTHPYARAFRQILPEPPEGGGWIRESLRILPGEGIEARVRRAGCESHRVTIRRAAGNPDEEEGVEILLDGAAAAFARFGEALPAGREAVWRDLAGLGVEVRLFTGDSAARARRTGIARVLAGAGPLAKRDAVRDLRAQGRSLLFVGDGINDAAAMAEAGLSLAVSHGAPLARAVASGIWDGAVLAAIPAALRIARQTVRRVHQNFRWALGYNIVGMGLAAAGLLHPVTAAVLMVASSTLVTWRALALLDAPAGAPGQEPGGVPAAKELYV